MIKRIRLAIALSLVLSTVAFSIEPEPSWKTRYASYKQEAMASFEQPGVGDIITLERRIGGEISGKVTAITAETITLGEKLFKAAQLTPTCCEKVFPDISAIKIAEERIKTEQEDYQTRKAEEIRKQQEAEAEQKAAAEEAESILLAQQKAAKEKAVQAEKQQKAIEAEENRVSDQAERAQAVQTRKENEQTFKTAFVVICIFGFLIYIIPSFIAFSRGHSNALAICVLNILLGWTFLGWAISLVWSFTSQDSESRRR